MISLIKTKNQNETIKEVNPIIIYQSTYIKNINNNLSIHHKDNQSISNNYIHTIISNLIYSKRSKLIYSYLHNFIFISKKT